MSALPWPTVLPLAGCQALLFVGNTIVISTTSLVGAQLAPTPLLATLPISLQFLAMMTGSFPISMFMGRFGRRPGFSLGALMAISAGALGTIAIYLSSFPLFCLASFAYGLYTGASSYFRFAAAEAAPAEGRSRAISLVLAGGVIAAFAGPALAEASRNLLEPFTYAGCYLVVMAIGSAMLLVLRTARFAPPAPRAAVRRGRPLKVIVGQPTFIAALLSAIVGQSSMSLLMVSTPLAMLASGHDFAATATTIQWHVVGMFAPSFFTGSLIKRFGIERIIMAGIALNTICVAVNVLDVQVLNFWIGLSTLGIGWNFMFIGATALLTTAYQPEEKSRVEALNEMLLFGVVALVSASSGALIHLLGWTNLNLLVLAPLALALTVLLVTRRARPLTVAAAR